MKERPEMSKLNSNTTVHFEQKSKLNPKTTVNRIVELAELMIECNANANYNVDTTPEMISSAKAFIDFHKLSPNYMNEVISIKNQYEALIDKKYGTKLPKKNFISNSDTQAYLDSKQVPQRTCFGPLKLCQYLLTNGVAKNGTETVFG